MRVKKKVHREIRLPALPPKKIPHIVKELVKALNKQKTDVRSFAASEKLSPSKVYNWIAGKAQPKRGSEEAILRYFKKIKYRYMPMPELAPPSKKKTKAKGRPKLMEDHSPNYYLGKLLATDKALYSKSLSVIMKDIQISLRVHSEQVEFLKNQLHMIGGKVKATSADLVAIQEYLAERHSGGDASKRVELLNKMLHRSEDLYPDRGA
ncbi:MAG: hypothetical protein J7578_02860 [Chitinophagaceae bacterium]|nr:hypothetical protein [Chitinophagaceae bacterium]